MPRPLRPLVVVLVVALALTACVGGNPPAATVDGAPITDDELRDNIALFRFLTQLSQQPCGRRDEAIGESQDSACARFTLSNMIQQDLVARYASSHDIQPDAVRVSDAIEQLERNLGGRDALDERLRRLGLERRDLLALARRLILFGQVQAAIAADEVTDQQVRDLYEEQRLRYTQLHVRHILVGTRSLASRIGAQVTDANFAELAMRHSTDQASAANGGDLGPQRAAQLAIYFEPGFVEAALSLGPGEIGAPVQTQFGWHVIQLLRVNVQPLREVRDEIAGPLAAEAFAAWLRDESRALDVTVNPRYGRFDPETGEIVPIRSTEREASPAAGPTGSATSSP
jgi:peptidyl-prolyl cis-trans isomerase C